MGFNMNPNILSGEYSAVHNNNTPILYKKDKYDHIYEMLEFEDKMDELITNEACQYYQYITLKAFDEDNKIINAENMRKVMNFIGEKMALIGKALGREARKIRISAQKTGAEDKITQMKTRGNYKVQSALIYIKNPTANIKESFSDITGMFIQTVRDLQNFSTKKIPRNINSLIAELEEKEKNETGNTSYISRIYTALGVRFVRENGTKLFYTTLVTFTQNSSPDIFRDRMAMLEDISVCMGQIADYCTRQKHKIDILATKLTNTNIDENSIRYLNYIRRKINYTYRCVINVIKGLDPFCNENTKQLEIAFRKIMGYIDEASIHGEEFNADTLFDNDSLEDFNKTEWMDLSLIESEYENRKLYRKLYREAYYKECRMYLSDQGPSIERLQMINEEMDQKTKQAYWENIQRVVREFINKWSNKLKNLSNTDKPYLLKYKDTILKDDRDANIFNGASTGGYIFTGYKILNSNTFKFPSFDYDPNSPEKNEKFKDKDTYLKSIINSDSFKGNHIKPEHKTENANDFLKRYFGAMIGKDVKITGIDKDIYETNMLSTMYGLLLNPTRIIDKINGDFNKIKSAVDMKDNTIKSQQANAQVQQNSAYSYVSDKFIHEFESAEPSKTGNNDDTKQDSPQNPATPNVDNNTNNQQQEKKTGVDYETAKRTYIQAMNDIIKAQLTAVEYIRNEFRQIIRHKVNHYFPDAKNEEKELTKK